MQLSASISVYLVFNKYGSENTTRTRLATPRAPFAFAFDACEQRTSAVPRLQMAYTTSTHTLTHTLAYTDRHTCANT